jgi:CelD/BcsL family acetyltransferase involved in cellulose biosynthesis
MRRLRLLSESFVIAPGVDVQSFHQLVFEEVARATDFDVIHLHELREDGVLWLFLNNPSAQNPYHLAYATEPQTSHDIRLQGDHSNYERTLKSENRKKLRKRRRLLTEHFHGDVRLVAVREAGQAGAFLNAVDEIAKHTWQARAYGARTRNAASDIAHFEFLAEHGWLRSYLLTGGGAPLAFQIGVQYAEQFHFLETGYDSRWSKFAPGNVLQTMLIEDLFTSNQPRFADYGFGEGESKRILGNISSQRWEHVFMVRNRATYPRAVFFGIALAAKTEAGVRKVLEWTGSERFIRNLLKRRGNDQ